MVNGDFKDLSEVEDIESHNIYAMAKGLGIPKGIRWNMIQRTSRDNARTPMQWSADAHAGFSSEKPWLKVNGNFAEVNVAAEREKADGVLAFWKKMIRLRRENEILCEGSFRVIWEGKQIYAFARELDGKKLISVSNMSGKTAKLPKVLQGWGKPIVSSYGGNDGGEMKPFEFRLYSVEDK
jgi:glycosidase